MKFKNKSMVSFSFRLSLFIVLFTAISNGLYAQSTINVVTTAVPFLRISPDARAGGMGDVGVATSPDAGAGFWNMGKVAFNTQSTGVSVTYTPWLKELVNDVYLINASAFHKVSENQAVNLNLRYFSLGNINFTDAIGNSLGSSKPRELSVDLGYSFKLSEKVGLGAALRYINSQLANGSYNGNTYKPGSAVAGDIGIYYEGKDNEGTGPSFGVSLTNLGSKIAYTNVASQKDFIPANLAIGGTWTKSFDEQNSLTFGVDINKTLVPTLKSTGGVPPTQAQIDDYKKTSPVAGWFKSFSDLPGQASAALGAEYWYNNQFALRAGYFFEDKTRGDRKFFTAGVGLKYSTFGLNFSYLAPSGGGINRNPLSNTLRFSILFDFNAPAE